MTYIEIPKSCKAYMPTAILIATNMAIYAYTSIIGGNPIITDYDTILKYGQVNAFVLFRGAWYQLFTALFIHVNIAHIAGNMFFFAIFGLRAEEMFDLKQYLAVYFLSGLAGNLLTLAFGPTFPPSAGASGAIFGVFGATIIYIRRAVGQSIVGALVVAFFLLLINSGPGVNNFAHLGGLVVGLLIGYAAAAATKRPKTDYQYSYSYRA